MFAVPGWSVSASGLKTETEQKKPKPEGAAPNKRKRATKKKDESVTDDNVANLWERVIEGKAPPKSNKRERAKGKGKGKDGAQGGKENDQNVSEQQQEPSQPARKRQKGDAGKPVTAPKVVETELNDEDEWSGLGDNEEGVVKEGGAEFTKKKTLKEKKREKKAKAQQAEPSAEAPAATAETPGKDSRAGKKDKSKKDSALSSESKSLAKTTTASTSAPAPAAPKLTPLQASMRAKLISARFRHLNETLYTRPSEESLRLFTDSPDMFAEYHEGFRRQVEVWPENPVDGYIRDIKTRAKVRHPPRDSKYSSQQPKKDELLPLPRGREASTIVDLGCGDARLAEVLTPLAPKLKLAIHSFDLHSPSPHVTRADIANVPLRDGAADVAIFCLALMGTNWLDFIEEAYRILRWKGELWIAEIKSRFAGKGAVGNASSARVEHSVGNRKRQQAVAKKGKPAEETEADKEELAIEVDGADDKRGETDLSAFVEALRKRGFVLQGEDMSNKMFVRMLFVKAATPTKGKGVEAAKAREAAIAEKYGEKKGDKNDRNKKQKRFVWDTKGEDDDDVDETGILKPCVYKLR